jgi:hypothetical protein
MKKAKQIFVACVSAAMICCNSVFVMPVLATDLNSIGGSSAVVQEQSSDNSNSSYSTGGNSVDYSTYEILNGQTAITQEEANEAVRLAQPVVKVIRIVMSLILAVLPVLILLSSLIDIACLCISPLRKAVVATSDAGGAGGGMGMGGMGGMGMGGPMGGGGAAAPVGWTQQIAQWASKEAQDTARECAGGGAGGGMGGMGMGMGMGMGGPAASAPSSKSLLITYLKKRVVFLVAFGVCVILFSCTAFTDLGLKIGAWIVEKVQSISF